MKYWNQTSHSCLLSCLYFYFLSSSFDRACIHTSYRYAPLYEQRIKRIKAEGLTHISREREEQQWRWRWRQWRRRLGCLSQSSDSSSVSPPPFRLVSSGASSLADHRPSTFTPPPQVLSCPTSPLDSPPISISSSQSWSATPPWSFTAGDAALSRLS